ncbi:MAG: VWA domain-containing protein [Kangiellaceae bacterium]|nr:VWA domain-containing protein [Kangiellaceae bacterium]
MPVDLANFHLIRPMLLLLLVPLFLVLFSVRHLARKQSSWQSVISPHLLKFLMVSGEKQRSYVGFWLTAVIGTLIIIASSGPSYREKAVPVFQTESARVILLDLSLSMDATDIKPARIARARHKIMDLLERADEGTIGLVVYAGDAFVISPLTSDANTIASMIPTLTTGIMPVLGSRPDLAIEGAISLLKNAKQSSGQIIWITDGIEKEYIEQVSNSIQESPYLLSILAVGTEQGAPIPLRDDNGFLKDNAGNIILPKLEADLLKQVTRATNGQYVELSADSLDVEFILSTLTLDANNENQKIDERINRWIDDGYWISWFILLLMLTKLFRRNDAQIVGIIGLSTILFIAGAASNVAHANVWDDLWKTRDQQASKAFKDKDYRKASELFENQQWQGASSYRSDDFTSALDQFLQSDSLESLYNQANTFAKTQSFKEAIELYSKVIESDSGDKVSLIDDAKFNKNLVEELLKQQQEQEKQDQEKQDQENQEKEESESDSDSQSDQNSEDDSDKEKNSEQQEQQQESEEQSDEQQEQQQAELTDDQRDKNEKDQALEHWLEKIPDDPGGLLRRKMYREYQKRGREQKEKKVW